MTYYIRKLAKMQAFFWKNAEKMNGGKTHHSYRLILTVFIREYFSFLSIVYKAEADETDLTEKIATKTALEEQIGSGAGRGEVSCKKRAAAEAAARGEIILPNQI